MTPHDSIALDTNCFIYLLEDPSGRRARFLEQQVLRPALRGERALTTSALTIAELLVVPYRAGEAERAAALRAALAAFDSLRIIDIGDSIAARAAHLRGTAGVTLPDAIHLAPDAPPSRTEMTSGCTQPAPPDSSADRPGPMDAATTALGPLTTWNSATCPTRADAEVAR